jgi:hypothetical protein
MQTQSAAYDSWIGTHRGWLAIIAASALLKLCLAVWFRGAAFNPDGLLYLGAAQKIAAGRFGEALLLHPMPFYSLLIFGVHCLVPSWIWAAKLVSLASAVLVLVPVYLLTRELFDTRAAFWACLALALAPDPNLWAVDILRGPAYVLGFTWAVYFAHRAFADARLKHFAAAAGVAWLALLLRMEGVVLIAWVGVWGFVMLWRPSARRAPLARGLVLWLGLPLGALLLISVLAAAGDLATWGGFNKVAEYLAILFRLDFLENYQTLYEQLRHLETLSPFPGGGQNFAEIARHYIPVIYLLGLLESMVKVLFPLYLVPLALGLGRRAAGGRWFVLLLTAVYLLVILYTMIESDYVQSRFLAAPAVLLYPWIGAGLDRLYTGLRSQVRWRWWRWATLVLLLVLMGAPLCEIGAGAAKEDGLVRQAGRWLAQQPALRRGRIVTTDERILYWAGIDYLAGRDRLYFYYNSGDRGQAEYRGLEDLARRKGAGLIVVRDGKKDRDKIPPFGCYRKVHEMEGIKDFAAFYQTTGACRPQGQAE